MVTELHMSTGGEALGAIVMGAVLATVGGVVATHLESLLRRRERERAAALLFGEILAALEIIAPLADDSRRRGDPYGPFTMRLVRAMRREAETYDRYREALYDIRDAEVRLRLYTFMVQLSLSLEGLLEGHERLQRLPPGPEREELEHDREVAFGFILSTVGEAGALIAKLRPFARHAFQVHRVLLNELRNAQAAPAP